MAPTSATPSVDLPPARSDARAAGRPAGTAGPGAGGEVTVGGPAAVVSRPSAIAISPTTQAHASGLNIVALAKKEAASLAAVAASMPCDTWSRSASAMWSSAAATSILATLGASGSRSFSRLDIVAGLDKTSGPYSATIARKAALVSLEYSGGVTAIWLARTALRATPRRADHRYRDDTARCERG